MKSGIYIIKCHANGRIYVGSAVNLKARWSTHRGRLKIGKHHSIILQRSWNKYGPDEFEFTVIESIEDKTLLVPREQYWMDYYQSYNPKIGFNISPTAGSQLGLKFPKSSLIKMRKKMLGKKLPKYWRDAIAAGLRGKKRPPHVIEAVRKSATGRKISKKTRIKMRLASLGRIKSPETRSRISMALRGKKKSSEHVAKIALKHRKLSDTQVSDAIHMFKEGLSTTKIATTLQVSQETITNNFKRVGFNYRPFLVGRKYIQRLTPDDYQEVKNLRISGISVKEISNKLNIHWSRIYAILRD